MLNKFSDRLKESIAAKEISASELSRISGVGKSDISNYLKDKYLPKQDKVFLLAKALNVDPGWLMTGVEQRTMERSIVIANTDLFRKLIMGMSTEDYKTVMEILERTELQMRERGEL